MSWFLDLLSLSGGKCANDKTLNDVSKNGKKEKKIQRKRLNTIFHR